MRLYEGLFVFAPDSGPDAQKEEFGAVESLLKKAKGSIKEKLEWGKKPLGYAIRKYRDGNFVILRIEMDPANVDGFKAALQLEEKVLKFMITSVDEKQAKKPLNIEPSSQPKPKEAAPAAS